MEIMKQYGLKVVGALLILGLAGYGLKSCAAAIKEKVCNEPSQSSDSGSWWDVKPSPK